jgi:hypothetical protein
MQIGYVKGLDIAAAEIEEAKRRFGELQARKGAGAQILNMPHQAYNQQHPHAGIASTTS